MTQEQKAKAYDKALERAKQVRKYSSDLAEIKRMEEIFPELCESEDEKIRKNIKVALMSVEEELADFYSTHHTSQEEFLAWLEKQGENSSNKIPIWKHWKDGIAGNGEGKPIYLIKDGGAYRISSVLGSECDYIKLSELDNLMLEKQKLTECIKFNNEFENQVSNLLASVLNGEHEYNESFVKYVAQSLLGYAKNELKPVEWSEEDEYMLNETIQHLEELIRIDKAKHLGCDVQYYQRDIDWLKSIKQRHVWKPTEKQMVALHDMNLTGNISYAGQGQALIELYNDLKKRVE